MSTYRRMGAVAMMSLGNAMRYSAADLPNSKDCVIECSAHAKFLLLHIIYIHVADKSRSIRSMSDKGVMPDRLVRHQTD